MRVVKTEFPNRLNRGFLLLILFLILLHITLYAFDFRVREPRLGRDGNALVLSCALIIGSSLFPYLYLTSKLRAILLFQIRRNIKQDNIHKNEETLRPLTLEQERRPEDLYLNRYGSSFYHVPLLLPWSSTINTLLRFFLVLNMKITLLNRSLWFALSYIICPDTTTTTTRFFILQAF